MSVIDFIRGLVRPLATFMLVATIVYGFVVGVIGPTEMIAMVGPVLGYWFGERATKKA